MPFAALSRPYFVRGTDTFFISFKMKLAPYVNSSNYLHFVVDLFICCIQFIYQYVFLSVDIPQQVSVIGCL